MDRSNSPAGAQTLAHGGPGKGLFAMFIGDYLKRAFERAQQFAGREEEVRIAGTAEAFIALTEGFEDQDAARREARDEMREMGPVEIIRDDDGVEGAGRKRPGAGFKIGGEDFQTRRVPQAAGVDVGGDDLVAHRLERAGMAAVAGGHIQNPAARANQRRPPQDPRGGRDSRIGGAVKTCHFLSINRYFHARSPPL